MKSLLKIVFVAMLVLNSCSKDNNDVITEPPGSQDLLKSNLVDYAASVNSTNQDQNYLNDLNNCFSFVYPFNVIIEGQEFVVNSSNELSELPEFEFVFPFSVLVDGDVLILNNDQEFFMILQDCLGDPDDPNNMGFCFVLIFPLSATDCDGSEVLLNSEEELFATCNTDLVFPLMVSLENGTDITVNNQEEFDGLYNECNDIDSCEDCAPVCFELIFPISFVNQSGEIIPINNENELYNFLENQNNDFLISYPVNVELENGTPQTINNDDEFTSLFQSCN